MTKKQMNTTVVTVIVFFAIVLSIVVGMNVKNTMDLRGILEESVKSQLISISIAARELIDVDAFLAYEDASVAQDEEYQQTLANLRRLCDSVGAKYIYALREESGDHLFIFDTDTENEEIFIDYDLAPVHEAAFAGHDAADILNVDDEYGSFNTGAVPIVHGGKVVGIVSTDIEDSYLSRSLEAATFNAVVLVVTLLLTMLVMLIAVIWLLRRISNMQDRLHHMAHYDNITGLPNRQYLLDYLEKAVRGPDPAPFALFFVDLDNFKRVNDNAGHDAGDELLRHIAQYLDGSLANSKAFRPSAGKLNIAARIGGDEFIQVIRGVSSIEEAEKLAQTLLANFSSQHTDRYVKKYDVGLSIGVALYPYHTNNHHVLIKYADVAMYHAKHAGKNQYRIYTEEMSGTAEEH